MAAKEQQIYRNDCAKMETHLSEDVVSDDTSCSDCCYKSRQDETSSSDSSQGSFGEVSDDELAIDETPTQSRARTFSWASAEPDDSFYDYQCNETALPQMVPCWVYVLGVNMPRTDGGDAMQTCQQWEFGVTGNMACTDTYCVEDASHKMQQGEGSSMMATPYVSYDMPGLSSPQQDLKAQQNDMFSDSQLVDGPTTVNMRNIPNNITRANLLDLLWHHGFWLYFDFLYLPMDFASGANLSYAFVNFVSAQIAQRFKDMFDAFDWGSYLGTTMSSGKEKPEITKKKCQVVWSIPLQGLHAHIERYRNSPVMHKDVLDEYRPVIFDCGHRVEFPTPTRKVRRPQYRERPCVGK